MKNGKEHRHENGQIDAGIEHLLKQVKEFMLKGD